MVRDPGGGILEPGRGQWQRPGGPERPGLLGPWGSRARVRCGSSSQVCAPPQTGLNDACLSQNISKAQPPPNRCPVLAVLCRGRQRPSPYLLLCHPRAAVRVGCGACAQLEPRHVMKQCHHRACLVAFGNLAVEMIAEALAPSPVSGFLSALSIITCKLRNTILWLEFDNQKYSFHINLVHKSHQWFF